MELEDLEPLVGEWATAVTLPGQDGVIRGRTSFAWLEGGGYLVAHSVIEDPRFPKAIMVIGPSVDGLRLVAHYFDSRGIARVYDVAFEAQTLRLWRDGPDFGQRFTGPFSADRATIDGGWERCDDHGSWRHDFDLRYSRVV